MGQGVGGAGLPLEALGENPVSYLSQLIELNNLHLLASSPSLNFKSWQHSTLLPESRGLLLCRISPGPPFIRTLVIALGTQLDNPR